MENKITSNPSGEKEREREWENFKERNEKNKDQYVMSRHLGF